MRFRSLTFFAHNGLFNCNPNLARVMSNKLCLASSLRSLCSRVAVVSSAAAEPMQRCSRVTFSLHVLPFHKFVIHSLVLSLLADMERARTLSKQQSCLLFVCSVVLCVSPLTCIEKTNLSVAAIIIIIDIIIYYYCCYKGQFLPSYKTRRGFNL